MSGLEMGGRRGDSATDFTLIFLVRTGNSQSCCRD